jgi:hypothetical protein
MTDDATIIEGDPGFIGMASRLNPVNLPPGLCQLVENMRLDRGVAQTRKGAKRMADNIAVGIEPLVLPFVLGNDTAISSISFSGTLATATTAAPHGYTTGQIIDIRGSAAPDDTLYNGSFAITVTAADEFEYTMSGTPAANAASAGLAVNDTITFSDLPPGSGFTASYLISLTPTATTFFISDINGNPIGTSTAWITAGVSKVNTSTGISYTIATFSSGQFTITGSSLIANDGPILQTNYTGGIFASGVFSSPDYDNANEWIVLCGPDQAYLWRQGQSIVSKSYPNTPPEEIEDTDQVSTLQAFNRFYILREADITRPGWGWKATTSTGITVSGTTATVNITAHGYTAGHRIRIEDGPTAAFAGHEYDIVTASTNSFTITVLTGTPTAAAAGIRVRRVKPPLVWDGGSGNFVKAPAGVAAGNASFKTMRSVGWGTYINNRVVIPDGRDSVAVSDVLDPDTYDPFFQNFRANVGSNDFLVAVHPWVDGSLLVFMRKSIYLAQVTESSEFGGSDSLVTSLTLLTNEIGCSARRSIQTAGRFVFFLSDAGVYRLDTQLDLKLRGDTLPLSDSIADQLEEINADFAHRAVGTWFANRYYLAVPIGNTENNNTLFIWNALNNQWETRDAYAIFLDELLVSDYSNRRRLFAASRVGHLFLLDEMERGDDVPNENTQDAFVPVPASLLTRRYGWGSLNAKRLLRAKATLQLPEDGSCTLDAVTTDYDADFQVAALTNTTGAPEDYTLKAPLRCKATYLDLRFSTDGGRPTLRQITAEATRSSMDPTETRTLN